MLNDNQIIKLILGFKLRYLRQQKSLSYQELSTMTGLSTSYLNDIEKGKRYPKPDKITSIAEALDVDYNYMVSTNASKKLQPIIDLLHSTAFKLFPLEEFGISTEKLLELFTQTPDKVTAFISTLFKLARTYQVGEREFYKEALRSYQDMYNNYFPELESAVQLFKQEFSIKGTLPYTVSFLEDQLLELYDISVERTQLNEQEQLNHIRSYYNPTKKTLFLNNRLSTAQQNFLISKELGFQYLQLQNRPYTSTMIKVDSFEMLLHNYQASHFAAALLMDEKELVEDIRLLARENSWTPKLILDLLGKYNVTPEMFLQRMTNILPYHFGVNDLFFMRLTGNKDLKSFKMTKDLHLSQLHSPYNNELDEHYCNRWVSITSIKQHYLKYKLKNSKAIFADAQISKYWKTDNEYLCISLARTSFENEDSVSSVTLGLKVTPQLRSVFHTLTDPDLKVREVYTTCERCGIQDCEARIAPATVLDIQEKNQAIIHGLEQL